MNSGIYLHIPFCRTRCNYCHFVTRPWQARTAKRYAAAVRNEIQLSLGERPGEVRVDTIYFGGGTPSIVPVEHIQDLIEAVRRLCFVSHECEITLEANPGSLTPGKAEAYSAMGINRVSLGAQSFDDDELAAIGRDHSGSDIDDSVGLLQRSGIANLNLDLMLGLPNQNEVKWQRNLERLARLDPSHVSVYMLDLDDKSPLYHEIARGMYRAPEDDAVSDLYLLTVDFLEGHGYLQYEISNFARPGFESRHNLKYWNCEPVLGFGVGSHSYDGEARYANTASVAAYLDSVEAGRSPVEWRKPVTRSQALEERLFLGLRLSRGIDWDTLISDFDPADLSRCEQSLRAMAERGLVEWAGSLVRLTRNGMLLSNEVFQEFV